jgi:hypothetical protein
MECESKLNLIANIINAEKKNEYFKEFQNVLYNDFVKFSNKDNYLANETKMFLKLQNIEKELNIISAYPNLYKKNIVAVGGGFSAGKSEFISSFIKSDIKLPIGVIPTTAIPSYVLNDKKDNILAISFKGAIAKIDKNLYTKLSHDFISSFRFNLKEIMPFLIVATNLKYKNICFIDTPGYNPSKSNQTFTKKDLKTARESLENAKVLIWLIGADTNGTIPSSDLKFLESLDLSNKKLFIVLNKSALKPESEIREIVEEINDTLEDEFIEFEGISAYDSKTKKEYFFIKKSLFDFLKENNKKSQKHNEIMEKLKEIYLAYKYAIIKKEKENQAIYNYLKSISLDMIEDDIDGSSAFEKIEKLKETFSSKKSKELLKELDKIFEKFKNCIDNIFESKSYFSFSDLEIREIEIDFSASSKEEGFDEVNEKDELINDLHTILEQLKKKG